MLRNIDSHAKALEGLEQTIALTIADALHAIKYKTLQPNAVYGVDVRNLQVHAPVSDDVALAALIELQRLQGTRDGARPSVRLNRSEG